jgi:pimeloyl-ACP methyl ester carboxylesterase
MPLTPISAATIASASAPHGVRPFRIDVDEEVLADLRRRLARARRPPAPWLDDWQKGTSRRYLDELRDHWRRRYDWRAEEARLNATPQFIASVDDEQLHFVHVRSGRPNATPILLLHGWPDSFDRYRHVVPQLAEADRHAASFDVVVPSLPGFAFTGALRRTSRVQPNRYAAELLWRLMTEVLGYRRFAVAGGDGGGVLAQLMAIHHPSSIVGLHLTDLGWQATSIDPSTLHGAEKRYVEGAAKQFMADGAYAAVQSTYPRSLAASLTDSPVGLASWIVDRFHSWADGELDQRFGKDTILTDVMLYWVTGTIGSSMRRYFDETRSPSLTPGDRVDRPVALAWFPREIGGIPPRSFAERTLNVHRWTEMQRGGHLGAMEEPELYARDVRAFFESIEPASGEVAT